MNVKGRKVVEFGFLETGPAEGAVEGNSTTSTASPVLRKIDIEIGTDASPSAMDLSATAVQQESQEKDEIAAVVSEPGITQPEQVVDLVMQELAREQGENVQVVKAE